MPQNDVTATLSTKQNRLALNSRLLRPMKDLRNDTFSLENSLFRTEVNLLYNLVGRPRRGGNRLGSIGFSPWGSELFYPYFTLFIFYIEEAN